MSKRRRNGMWQWEGILLLFPALAVLTGLLTQSVYAEIFTENGVTYELHEGVSHEWDIANKKEGTYSDAAGLLTYSDDGSGGIIIMSCSVAAQGEMYLPAKLNGQKVTAINEFAFLYCSGLTELYLPKSVTKIGANAFTACTGLQTLTIAGEDVVVDARAFAYCSGLEEITFQTVTTLGEHAFEGCLSLTEVTLPAISRIEPYTFAGCTGLSTLQFTQGPETIGDYAFQGCTGLVDMPLPEGLTTLGNGVFQDCTGLRTVAFPSTLSDIGNSTFQDCTVLETVSFSTGLRSLGQEAFRGCSSLTNMTLPDGLERVGSGVFYACGALESAALPESLNAEGADSLFYDCRKLTQVHIPDGWMKIPDKMFYRCSALQDINLSGIEVIGSSAFYSCSALTTVDFPDTLRQLGANCFHSCTGLTSVSLPEGVTEIGTYAFSECTALTRAVLPDGLGEISGGLFRKCTALSDVNIPQGITTIGDAAFFECPLNTAMPVPAGVTRIGQYAFSGCGLTALSLPDTLTWVGNSAFSGNQIAAIQLPDIPTQWGTNALESCQVVEVVIPGGMQSVPNAMFKDCATLERLVIEEGITQIAYSAFEGCTALTQVVIPESVDSIQGSAFGGCTALAQVVFPESMTLLSGFNGCVSLRTVTMPEQVEQIGDSIMGAFTGAGLREVVIPASVKSIAGGSFSGCADLERVTVQGDSGLASGLFSDCPALTSVELGPAVTTIPGSAFAGCTALQRITFPSGLQVIGAGAFDGCTALREAALPEGVRHIQMWAFRDCGALQSISLPASLEQIDAESFQNAGLVTVTLADALPESSFGLSYSAMAQWVKNSRSQYPYDTSPFSGCALLEQINIPSGWTGLPDYFLCDCSGPLELVLPDTLLCIGQSALRNTGMTSLEIPDGLLQGQVGEYALAGNIYLEEIVLPETWHILPEGLFMNNTVLTSYVVPEQITEIGQSAFENSALAQITFHDAVTTIEARALKGCTNLTALQLPGVDTIPAGLCLGCTALTTVVVGEGTREIERMAFGGCGALMDVTLPDSVTAIDLNAFLDSNMGHVRIICSPGSYADRYTEWCLYLNSARKLVPEGMQFSLKKNAYDLDSQYSWSVSAYTVDYGGWSYEIEYDPKSYALMQTATVTGVADKSAASLSVPADLRGVVVTGIGSGAFSDMSQLQDITLPDTVTTIGVNAFRNCTALTQIRFPSALKVIETSAFSHTGLTAADLSQTEIDTIGIGAFYGAENLTDISFKESLRIIDYTAFTDTGLTDVYLPATLDRMELNAFEDDVTFHFTGDAFQTYYSVLNSDADSPVDYDLYPVVDKMLQAGKKIAQFYGAGLNGQDTYYIATSSAGYAAAAEPGAEGIITGLPGDAEITPEGAPGAALEQQAQAWWQPPVPDDAEHSEEAEPQEVTTEDAPQEAEEPVVYEVFQQAVRQNPAVIAILLGIIAVVIAIGAFSRVRKGKREQ